MQRSDFHASVQELEEAILETIASHFRKKGRPFDPSKIPDYFECVNQKSYDAHFLGANVFPIDSDEQIAA